MRKYFIVKRRIYLPVLFCFLCITAAGQERNISFKTNPPDKASVARLIRQGTRFKRTDPDSAIALNKEALSISRDLRFNQGIARSLMNLGVCLFSAQGHFKQSKALFLEAIPYCYLAAGENPGLVPDVYINLGNVYAHESYYDSAFYFYYIALGEINRNPKKDSTQLLLAYINIGGTLGRTGQDRQALYYLQKSASVAMNLRDSARLARSYASTASIYTLVNMDSARYYWDLAIPIYQQLSRKEEIQRIYTSIGTAYMMQQNPEKALPYFHAAVAADSASAAGNAYLQQALGGRYHEEGNYKKAIPYFKRALALCEQQGMRQPMRHAYWGLASSYAQTGNDRLAFTYQQKHSLLIDSLMNEDMAKTINKMEVQYRTREKDKILTQQNLLLQYKESKLREKNLWIGGIALSSSLSILLLINFFRHRQKIRKEKMITMERDQEAERLQAAVEAEEQERNRIARDLHDGVGVLLSAAMMNYTALGKKDNPWPLSATDTYQEGLKILQEMQKEIRVIAHNLVPDVAARQNLAEALQTLIKRIEQGRDIKIELSLYGRVTTLEPERNLSVYRMMEELIQNVIKHAEATQIQIQLMFHEEQLNIIVEDNGKGFDTEIASGGMGLHNLHNRAEKLNGHLSIVSQKGSGTTVEFEVPYHKGEKNQASEIEGNYGGIE